MYATAHTVTTIFTTVNLGSEGHVAVGLMWSAIVAPIRSFFAFDYVLDNFRTLIESLFLSIAAQPVSVTGGGGTIQMPRPFTPARFQDNQSFFHGTREMSSSQLGVHGPLLSLRTTDSGD
jgi:hypothetical protein